MFEIINGNCLDVLERLAQEGRQFDAVVADPPYCSGGVTPASIKSGVKKYIHRTDLGDFGDGMTQHAYVWFTRLWLEACRNVLKSPGYVFMFIDWRQLPTASDALQVAGYIWRGVAVWDKGCARPNKGQLTQSAEFIVWGTKDAAKSEKVVHAGVVKAYAPTAEARIHPTQKTPSVISSILKVLPDDATSVLDPFAGSGSTGISALECGLDFVGIEANARYCELARGRLEATEQLKKETGQTVDQHRKTSFLWS